MSSPILPFERLTSSIFAWSMICRRSKVLGRLRHNVSDERIGEEPTDLVEGRGCPLGLVLCLLGEAVTPVGLDDWVGYSCCHLLTTIFLREHYEDVEEGRAFVGQEGQRAVSKRVLQVWAPGVVEELAEGSHCLRANPVYQSRIVPVGALKEIEGKGLVRVGRVKKDDVIGPSRGHAQ